MVAAVDAETAAVETVKEAVVAPAATVTEAGAVADEELLLRVTTAPPIGAAPLKVTVPWELTPPSTEVGLRLTDDNTTEVGGVTVKEAVLDTLRYVAVMVAVVEAETAEVEMVNETLELPAGTVTEAGVLAADLLLLSVTTAPPGGAHPVSVTVPWEEPPPFNDAGFKATELMAASVTVRDAVLDALRYVAVMVAVVEAVTVDVETVNETLELPAGTVTEAGVVAADLLLLRVTTAPPEGAAPVSVIVPWEVEPPATDVGIKATELIAAGVIVRDAVFVVPL
jgi:hypothetical protein